MIPDRQRALEAMLRGHFPSFLRKSFGTLNPGQPFTPEWHHLAIAYQLERVRRGECRRLIINLPPRSLKSLMISVVWPAFLHGHDPTLKFVCASYSRELAHKMSNDYRTLLAAAWYRRLFPETRVSPLKDTQDEVELTARGLRLATSVGGTLTGRGGDILIVDDPLKPGDVPSEVQRTAANTWYSHTLLSRLDDKRRGAIVIVMQRLHLDDLTGHVLSLGNEWKVLSLPAIAAFDETIPLLGGGYHRRRDSDVLSPEREPLLVLEELRRQQGSELFSAQYLQSPVPPGGAMIKRAWIRRYVDLPPLRERWGIVQSWDTAMKGGPNNDWSVCTTWLQASEGRWFLRDVWRGRVDYPALKAKVLSLAARWNAAQVLVEEAGTAIGLLDELRHAVRGLKGIRHDRDKVSRMAIASAPIEEGLVFLPERADWLQELEQELFAFPNARHDDQVDSISQALLHGKTNLAIWAKLGAP